MVIRLLLAPARGGGLGRAPSVFGSLTGEVVGMDSPWSNGPTGIVEPDDANETSWVHPPVALLAAAGATAVISLLLWLPGSLLLHGVGYALSTFITLGLLAGFKRQDLRARQSPFYAPRSNLGPISVVVTVLAVLGAMAHVWVITTFWAG
jgi:hypothetical protein